MKYPGELKKVDLPEEKCNDCGYTGVKVAYKGPLIPNSREGKFCCACWESRENYFAQNEKPKPMPDVPPNPTRRCC